jgi:hypothetical protein
MRKTSRSRTCGEERGRGSRRSPTRRGLELREICTCWVTPKMLIRSSEQQNRSARPARLSQPDPSLLHGWTHDSTSVQTESTLSGCFAYASLSAFSMAARTASVTPWRAAAEMFTPNLRASWARSSSRLKVVRVDVKQEVRSLAGQLRTRHPRSGFW